MLAILLPAPLWVSLTMVALILCGSVFTVTVYADDIRATRLRQHDLPCPDQAPRTIPGDLRPPTPRHCHPLGPARPADHRRL